MLMNNNEYIEIIETIKGEIRGAQYKAALSVNRELIMLYYHIGTVINEHKTWGSKFIENLAADIRIAFPNVKGYSVRNLKYMAKFAETYPDEEFVQTVSAQIPWSHNTAILDKVKDAEQRVWYIKKTAENGWSHNVLIHQIESGLYKRQALAEKISTAVENGTEVTIKDVIEMVGKAIQRSNRFFRKMKMGKRRYDENDFIILFGKDFGSGKKN